LFSIFLEIISILLLAVNITSYRKSLTIKAILHKLVDFGQPEFMSRMWLSFLPLIYNKITRSCRNFLKKRSCQKKVLQTSKAYVPRPYSSASSTSKTKTYMPRPRAHHTTTSCELSRQPGNICFQIFLEIISILLLAIHILHTKKA
jgi:hypothetical protein